MSFYSAFRTAFRTLLAHKGRFILTSLGIVIGISAVITLVSAGSGAQQKLDERLTSVGKNLIILRPGARQESGGIADRTPLKQEDADAIRREIGPLLLGVAPTQASLRTAVSAAANWATAIVGSTPDLQPVCDWQVRHGRFLSEEDVKQAAPVCVIGQTVRRKLFQDKPNPVGETVRIDRLQVRVVGVLGDKGPNPIGADQDDQIFLPITTLQRKLAGSDSVAMILASARSEDVIQTAQDAIGRLMRQRRHLKPSATDDFDVSSVREQAELAKVLSHAMQWLIAGIASISLVVGGIGIMNIMLVSVTERTREIGLRMAVGATSSDVLAQFLVEAMVLALVGGILGTLLGVAGAFLAAQLGGWPVVISPNVVLVDFAIAAGIGLFFGSYPAWKASRLDPIHALRYE